MGPASSTKVAQKRCGLKPAGGSVPDDPLVLEDRVHDEIDIVVIEPFGFAQDSFLDKPKPFGNGAALGVTRGAMQNHAIAVLFGECKIRDAGYGARDDTLALVILVEP